jgi:hypothetical protein
VLKFGCDEKLRCSMDGAPRHEVTACVRWRLEAVIQMAPPVTGHSRRLMALFGPHGFPITIAIAAARNGNGSDTAARNQTKRAGMNGISHRIMRWKANSAHATT